MLPLWRGAAGDHFGKGSLDVDRRKGLISSKTHVRGAR
jgi:hypothetical protein